MANASPQAVRKRIAALGYTFEIKQGGVFAPFVYTTRFAGDAQTRSPREYNAHGSAGSRTSAWACLNSWCERMELLRRSAAQKEK